MKKITICYLEKKLEIMSPKKLSLLVKEISNKFLLTSIMASSELVIYYKDPKKIILKNDNDYNTFLRSIQKILYVDVDKNNKLSKNSLENVKNENENEKKQINRHYGIKCDGCNAFPIVGNRYKCMVCESFNYCENCEEKYANEHSHPFLKITSEKMNSFLYKMFIRQNPKFEKIENDEETY